VSGRHQGHEHISDPYRVVSRECPFVTVFSLDGLLKTDTPSSSGCADAQARPPTGTMIFLSTLTLRVQSKSLKLPRHSSLSPSRSTSWALAAFLMPKLAVRERILLQVAPNVENGTHNRAIFPPKLICPNRHPGFHVRWSIWIPLRTRY